MSAAYLLECEGRTLIVRGDSDFSVRVFALARGYEVRGSAELHRDAPHIDSLRAEERAREEARAFWSTR